MEAVEGGRWRGCHFESGCGYGNGCGRGWRYGYGISPGAVARMDADAEANQVEAETTSRQFFGQGRGHDT